MRLSAKFFFSFALAVGVGQFAAAQYPSPYQQPWPQAQSADPYSPQTPEAWKRAYADPAAGSTASNPWARPSGYAAAMAATPKPVEQVPTPADPMPMGGQPMPMGGQPMPMGSNAQPPMNPYAPANQPRTTIPGPPAPSYSTGPIQSPYAPGPNVQQGSMYNQGQMYRQGQAFSQGAYQGGMYVEQGGVSGGPTTTYVDQGNVYSDWNVGAGAACGPGTGGAIGGGSVVYAGGGAAGLRDGWFATFGGVMMGRDDENAYFFSFDDTNESIQRLNTEEASMDFSAGVETRIGYFFNCGQNAFEAVYWGVYPDQQESTLLSSNTPGNLNGILNWDQIDYNGVSADNWVNAAFAHRLRREFEIHNLELNVLGIQSGWSNGRTSMQWRTGMRFFHFRESLQFGADNTDANFIGAANEIYYDVETANNLLGWQFGADLMYRPTCSLTFRLGASTGLYGNYVQHHSRIGGSAGVASINNGPNNNMTLQIDNDTVTFAMLGELNAGFDYQISCCWSMYAGYRVLGVSRVALPTNQIYFDLRGINDVREIDTNGDLILHGGYAGLEYNY